jgi:type I restriction enzyme R subunit
MSINKEAKARIKINNLLQESEWRFFDNEKGKANITLENNVKIDELGDDFEKVSTGFIDYLLLDDKNFPICVLEAKSEDKDPLVGKEQARRYANSQNVRFVILSNGNIHYFWDKELGNPTRISTFPTLESLKGNKEFNPNTDKLTSEELKDNYIALTQNPFYEQDPRWSDEGKKQNFITDTGLHFLRQYQLDAVKSLQRAVSEGKNRFLFEMATGTGKTLLASAIIKLYLKTGNARRVLFLVDRLELENQAEKAFKNYLQPDYRAVIFKQNRDDWRKAEVVITTIQSISHDNKYLKTFTPTDFDLIISDEAHRSISGNSRTIFEYFIGHKLGLTATPKDYLKNLSQKDIDESDPREMERRNLLSTYKTFGCDGNEPTFRYTLVDGAKDGFLVLPTAIDCRTEITTKLLSDEGYAVQVETEEGEEEEVIYNQRDFERHFFSEQTNFEFVKAFMDNAQCDPITKEIGKTIVFCVSRKHASKITQILNEFAMKMFPDKYNSDFAIQITSDIPNAQNMTTNFANNKLSGISKFLDGYKTSKTRVCVTVGMMTTGYDCQDLVNLCLMRPIFSPTDFVQIKGRGTRTYVFKHSNGDDQIKEKKENYKLFDFFANCEYFQEKYPYDEVIKLPPRGKGGEGGGGGIPSHIDPTLINIPDPLKMMEVMNFEGNIMRVDKELYVSRFETTIKEAANKDSEFKGAVDSGDYEQMEQYVKENIFNKPEDYFTMERVRQGYKADRHVTLWEILDKIFGRISRFKSKDELAQEEFDKYLVNSDISPEVYYEAREFFRNYLIDEDFRIAVNQKRFNEYAGNPVMLEVFQKLGKERISQIPEYIRDNVKLNTFV